MDSINTKFDYKYWKELTKLAEAVNKCAVPEVFSVVRTQVEYRRVQELIGGGGWYYGDDMDPAPDKLIPKLTLIRAGNSTEGTYNEREDSVTIQGSKARMSAPSFNVYNEREDSVTLQGDLRDCTYYYRQRVVHKEEVATFYSRESAERYLAVMPNTRKGQRHYIATTRSRNPGIDKLFQEIPTVLAEIYKIKRDLYAELGYDYDPAEDEVEEDWLP